MAIYVRNSDGSIDTLKIVTLKGDQGEQGIPGEKGQDGINGIDGKDGITPNIQIGTVTTLEAGQKATVENVGTLENPVFNFGIPKGEDGTGGGSTEFKLLKDITLEEEVSAIEINCSENEWNITPKEVYFIINTKPTSTNTATRSALIDIKDTLGKKATLSLIGVFSSTLEYTYYASVVADNMEKWNSVIQKNIYGNLVQAFAIQSPISDVKTISIYSVFNSIDFFGVGTNIKIYGR